MGICEDGKSLDAMSLEGTAESLLGTIAGGLLGGIVTSVITDSRMRLPFVAGSLGLPCLDEEDTMVGTNAFLYGVGDIGGWLAWWPAPGRTGVTGRGVASGDAFRVGEARLGVGVAGCLNGLPGAALVCLLCVAARDG